MNKVIDQGWQDWIHLNVSRGCDKDGIARTLLAQGFDPAAIVAAMRYVPYAPDLIAAMNRQFETPAAASTDEAATFAAIDAVRLPFAQRLQTDKAHVYRLENFLSEAECDELVRRIRQQHRQSTVTQPDADHYVRTSKTSDLGLDADAFIQDIDRRIADYMGFEVERGETLQGQFYEPGEEFKAHTDYFEPGTDEYRVHAGERGQRTWTFMIYLNEVEEGGVTEFVQLKVGIRPRRGMALIWNSLHVDGSVNPFTLHWARPVLRGEKFVVTKWFRTHGALKQAFRPDRARELPVFTREGFARGEVPLALAATLAGFYAERRMAGAPERSDAIGTFIQAGAAGAAAHMIELEPALRARVSSELQPLLEAWVKRPLRMTAVYGIREYRDGATLKLHADRVETHVVSAIINVAQDVRQEWPLVIHDHLGRRHSVLLQPGQLLFYESARLKHGRPEPLQGAAYANVFVHAAPAP